MFFGSTYEDIWLKLLDLRLNFIFTGAVGYIVDRILIFEVVDHPANESLGTLGRIVHCNQLVRAFGGRGRHVQGVGLPIGAAELDVVIRIVFKDDSLSF